MQKFPCVNCQQETEGTYNQGGILTGLCSGCRYAEEQERQAEREAHRGSRYLPDSGCENEEIEEKT